MAIVKVAVVVAGIATVVGTRPKVDLTLPLEAVVGTRPHLGIPNREVGISSRWLEGTLDAHMTVGTSLVGRMCILAKADTVEGT